MKAKNYSIKGAVVSASLAAIVGGWALLGYNDRSQTLASNGPTDDLPDLVPSVDESANYVPLVETVPVSGLLTAGLGPDWEIADLDLNPIPEVVRLESREDTGLGRVSQLTSWSRLTIKSIVGNESQPSPILGKADALPASSVSAGSNLPQIGSQSTPVFEPLPPLPGLPSLDQTQMSSTLNLPPMPTVTKRAPQPKPAIRTQSSR